VSRVIVLGGQGLFGRTVVEQLKALGIATQIAARRTGADLQVDANDSDSIRRNFSAGDLVIDTAGPFQQRSLALLDSALEIGFDLIDINDNLGYAERVLALREKIAYAGIRVLSSSSSVSALAAAMVRQSKIATPVRVTSFLAPASRHTANRGSALSLIQSLGQPVRTLRNGELQTLRGWEEKRLFAMPDPVGKITGRLFESADAVYLPRIWPSLRMVAMYIDPNTPGVRALLSLGARFPMFRRLLERQLSLGTWLSRKLGSTAGGVGYEIEETDGSVVRCAMLSQTESYLGAVAPAILAAQSIVEHRFQPTGLVLPDQHVEPEPLFSYLESSGFEIRRLL